MYDLTIDLSSASTNVFFLSMVRPENPDPSTAPPEGVSWPSAVLNAWRLQACATIPYALISL